MPTYSYVCTACEHRFDAQQSFADAALTACPECDGMLRKLFGNVGVVFKGPGFYRTDARAAHGRNGKPSKTSGGSGGSTSPAPATTSGTTSGSGGTGGSGTSGASATPSSPSTSAPAAASA